MSEVETPVSISTAVYLVNLLFFIDMTVVIFTGILISESALPALGVGLSGSHAWQGLHTTAANLALPILGLHLALHWRWIVNTTTGYFRKLRPSAPTVPQPAIPKGFMQKGISS